MSDTPPDRKEEAGAPEGPRNPWVGYLVWAILGPVLYVLSLGPAYWLVHKHYVPQAVLAIYSPMEYLPEPIVGPLGPYIDWWIEKGME